MPAFFINFKLFSDSFISRLASGFVKISASIVSYNSISSFWVSEMRHNDINRHSSSSIREIFFQYVSQYSNGWNPIKRAVFCVMINPGVGKDLKWGKIYCSITVRNWKSSIKRTTSEIEVPRNVSKIGLSDSAGSKITENLIFLFRLLNFYLI